MAYGPLSQNKLIEQYTRRKKKRKKRYYKNKLGRTRQYKYAASMSCCYICEHYIRPNTFSVSINAALCVLAMIPKFSVWEGNRRSGVALAVRHRLKWFVCPATGSRETRTYNVNSPTSHVALFIPLVTYKSVRYSQDRIFLRVVTHGPHGIRGFLVCSSTQKQQL